MQDLYGGYVSTSSKTPFLVGWKMNDALADSQIMKYLFLMNKRLISLKLFFFFYFATNRHTFIPVATTLRLIGKPLNISALVEDLLGGCNGGIICKYCK